MPNPPFPFKQNVGALVEDVFRFSRILCYTSHGTWLRVL